MVQRGCLASVAPHPASHDWSLSFGLKTKSMCIHGLWMVPRKLELFIYLFIYFVRLSPLGTERCGGQSGQLECLPPNPSTQGHTKHIRWDSRNCRWEAGREMGLGGGEAQQALGAQMSAFPEAHTVALCVRAKGREGWRAVT